MLTIRSQRPLFDIPAGIALWFAKISQRQTRPLATRAEAAMLNHGRPRYPDCSAPDYFGEQTSKSRFENLALRQQLAVYRRTRPKLTVRWSDRLFWVGLQLVCSAKTIDLFQSRLKRP